MKSTPGVNFNNNLQAAFVPIDLCCSCWHRVTALKLNITFSCVSCWSWVQFCWWSWLRQTSCASSFTLLLFAPMVCWNLSLESISPTFYEQIFVHSALLIFNVLTLLICIFWHKEITEKLLLICLLKLIADVI